MRPTALSQGIAIFSILLAVYAIVFDSTGALAICLVFGFYLLSRAFWSARNASLVLSSTAALRHVEKRIVREGKGLKTTLDLVVQVPASTTVVITERLPPGAFARDGEVTCRFETAGNHDARLEYELVLFHGGNVTFPGLFVELTDLFFTSRFALRASPENTPLLRVEPVRVFYHEGRKLETISNRELERLSVLRGIGIRSYRVYLPGDDYRQIDWKLTAKSGKMMIREYSGQVSVPPILICDLPDRHHESDTTWPDLVSGAVISFINGIRPEQRPPPVAVISGVNFLDYIPSGTPVGKIQESLENAWQPRCTHAYRWPDPAVVRGGPAASRESAGHPGHSMEDILRETRSGFSSGKNTSSFESMTERFLALEEGREVILFSLAAGDISHIGILARCARRTSKRLRLWVSADACTPERLKQIGRLPVDGVTRFS